MRIEQAASIIGIMSIRPAGGARHTQRTPKHALLRIEPTFEPETRSLTHFQALADPPLKAPSASRCSKARTDNEATSLMIGIVSSG